MNLSIIIVGKNKQECSVAIKSINSDFEIVIATGDNPSKQRNDAVDFATNEHLLFLDGDSIASDTLFNEYRPFIENNTNNLIIGGPCIYKDNNSNFNQLLNTFFQSNLGSGHVLPRYKPVGKKRECKEHNLILCNLIISKKLFLELGGFNNNLYPNEENDFFARAQTHSRLFYLPSATIYKLENWTLLTFIIKIFTYGRGRSRRLIISKKPFNLLYLAPSALILTVFFYILFDVDLLLLPILIYMSLTILTSIYSLLKNKNLLFLFLPFIFFIGHIAYGVGIFTGLTNIILVNKNNKTNNIAIEVLNQSNPSLLDP